MTITSSLGPDGYTVSIQSPVSGGVNGASAWAQSASDVPDGSGPLNGTYLDSGQQWECGGAGYLTTSINPGGWIEGSDNTYCKVNTGATVARYRQSYRGSQPTLAIMKTGDISQDMLHVNFTSGGSLNFAVWKSGVTYENLSTEFGYATLPAFNDGSTHNFDIVVDGKRCLAYVDDVLVGACIDSKIPSVVGPWIFAQIHAGAGERIYGVQTWNLQTASAAVAPVQDVQASTVRELSAWSFRLGNPSGSNYVPTSRTYYYSDDPAGHVFGANQHVVVRAVANTGYGVSFGITSFVGATTEMYAGGDGSGQIRHQGNTLISLPFNVQRVDAFAPLKLKAYTVATLPSASTYAQCLIYVSDGTGNKRMAVSDGATWRWPDGAVVS